MSKVCRLLFFFLVVGCIYPTSAIGQICRFSTPLCDLDDIITGDVKVTMPDTNNYMFYDEIRSLDTFRFTNRFGWSSPSLFNFFANTNPSAGFNGACGGGAFGLDNPTIYTLTAISTTAKIDFFFDECDKALLGGVPFYQGFQVAVIKNCYTPEIVVCEEHRDEENVPLNIVITNAEIGAEYYLIIDGYAGSKCDYRVQNIEGFAVNNIEPVETVFVNDEDSKLNPEFCSASGLTFEVLTLNSRTVFDAEWRIKDETGTIVYRADTSGPTLKADLDEEGDYTFEVVLKSSCSDNIEEFTQGRFQIKFDVADTHIIDVCGPGPFDTLGVTIDQPGLTSITIDNSTSCQSVLEIDASFLDIQNGMLIQNSCNQIEFLGDILDPSTIQSFTWKDGAGNPITNSSSDPRLLDFQTSGSYSLEIVLKGTSKECLFSYGTIDVDFDPLTFSTTCLALNTESLGLDWDDVPGAVSYTVSYNGISEQVPGSQSNLIIQNLPRETTVEFTILADVGGSCTPQSIASCTTELCDSNRNIEIENLQIDSLICLSDPQSPVSLRSQLRGSIETPVITWFINGVQSTDGMFDPSSSGIGVYEVMARLDDTGCQSSSETTTIEVLGFDNSVGFEIDQRVCANTEVSIMLTGTIYDEAIYNLTTEGGAIQTGLLTQGMTLNWPSVGEHTVSLFLGNDDCRSAQDIKTTVMVEPVTGVNDVRINSNSKSATFQWEAVACADEYVIYLNDVQTDVTSNTSYTYIFDAIEDEVDFRVGIESGSCFCTQDSPTTTAFKSLCPNIVLDIEQVPTICLETGVRTDPIVLSVDIIGQESEGELIWSGIGVLPDGRFVPNLVDVGTHTITATYTEDSCPFSESIQVKVVQKQEISYVVQPAICPGEQALLVIDNFGDYTVFANDEPVLSAEYMLAPGDYTLEFAIEDGCEIFEEITVENLAAAEIGIKGPRNMKEGFDVEYVLDTEGFEHEYEQVDWFFNGESQCAADCGDSFQIDDVQSSGEICVQVLYNNDCTISSCMNLVVDPKFKVYIPNSVLSTALPPNNRFRVILKDELAEIEEVSVYDRSGGRVYSEININSQADYIGWTGKDINDQKLLPGVYVYIAKIRKGDGDLEVLTGDITLLH